MKLLILPGWGQDKTHWQAQVELLQTAGIDAQAIDLPGFGSEPLISNGWGLPEYAKWVQERVSKEKLTQSILLGHSFGGRTAAYLCSKLRLRPKKLILYAAPLLYRPSKEVKIKSGLAKILKVFLPETVKSNLLPADLKDAKMRGMEQIFRSSVVFDQTKYLELIATPTHLIWGERDQSVDLKIAIEMQKLIPGSTLTVLPDLGHNAHLESPQLFYATIKKICESN